MKSVIVLLLITALCACAAKPPDDTATIKSASTQWVGRTVDELISTYGDPIDVYMVERGGRVFEYMDIESAMIGTQQENARKKQKEFLETTRDQPGMRKRLKRKKLTSDKSQSCVVMFYISASDIIESWSIESGECK